MAFALGSGGFLTASFVSRVHLLRSCGGRGARLQHVVLVAIACFLVSVSLDIGSMRILTIQKQVRYYTVDLFSLLFTIFRFLLSE